jgi:ribosomal-protein-alanine N-acetyltransferase
MVIQTARLALRQLQTSDAKAYFELSQNDGFRRFQISNYRRSSIKDAEQWIDKISAYHQRNGTGVIGVFDKKDSQLIGLCALKYLEDEGKSPIELMYRIDDRHWGQGYGFEIGQALISYAFTEMKLEKLVATVDPRNIPSKRILAKLGFRFLDMIKIESFDEELHELRSTR